MKIVKLNSRFTLYKEHGYKVAMRFDHWGHDVSKVEKLCVKLYGHHGYRKGADSDWYAYFGHNGHNRSKRPYWICFRTEADLTAILLMSDVA
jgi:hypothetical protein